MTEWLSGMGAGVANHLWQSTAFAAVVWGATLLLRKNAARVRYGLWVAASAKFLVPFSLLIALGGMLPRPHHAVVTMPLYSAVDEVGLPFSDVETAAVETPTHAAMRPRHEWGTQIAVGLAGVWVCGLVVVLGIWCGGWRKVRRTLRRAVAASEGREAEILRRVQARVGGRRVRLVLSREWMEPGIFGIWRPVLIWPEGLSARLDDQHIEAIVAHELMHARRRDNLTAALHMLVEAAFWFHPLVWWMERRMVEERERACDEAVVEMGSRPGVYAESLLKAVRFCVESPLVCVAGVTGADLAGRVRSIMTLRLKKLGLAGKVALAVLGLGAVGAPILLGQAQSAQRAMLAAIQFAPKPFRAAARAMIPEIETPSMGVIAEMQSVADPSVAPLPMYEYEAATVKPSKGPGPDHKIGLWAAPDGFSAWFITPQQIISLAYGVKSFEISGGPSWLASERFDIEAKMDATTADALGKLSKDPRALAQQQMLQALLRDRFQLTAHHETKELTSYTLVLAKGGSKLQEAKPGDTYPNAGTSLDGTHLGAGSMWGSQITGDLTAQAVPIAKLVLSLTQMLGHPVSDKTELKGIYDFKLRYTPDDRLQPPPGAPPNLRLSPPQADSNAPSLFDALQEQLGLKLVAGKGPVDVIVIDRIEKPASVDGAEVQGPTAEDAQANTLHGVYKTWLDQDARWLITPAERGAFLVLTNDQERDDFIQNFWERRGRAAGMSGSAYKAAVYSRIAYANEHFASMSPGWSTDRGRIYVVFGKPDEVKAQPADGMETWVYRSIAGVGENVTLKFVKGPGTADYRLTTPYPVEAVAQRGQEEMLPDARFEVASIRMVDAHSAAELQRGIGLFDMCTFPTTHFFVRNAPLDFLIGIAYGMDEAFIQKDADWMDSQLYDVEAKVKGERPLSQEEIRPLLRNLLTERFHFAAHRMRKTVSGFELVIAKEGPKLKPAKEGTETHAQILPNGLDAQSASSKQLASFLMRPAGQTVVDKTGLSGSYDIKLRYAPTNDPNSALPSLFTAVQEQLGLRLQPAKVPADYLVVDHAERVPTEN